jgi:hypothetical protein
MRKIDLVDVGDGGGRENRRANKPWKVVVDFGQP